MSSPPAPVPTTELQPAYTGDAVEVADDFRSDNDDDSSYGDSAASSATASLASSILSYTYENGRRYHSDRFKGEYFMPNDEGEQDRLDLYHYLFLRFLGGELYTAPLDRANVHRVLDVGTGTGIWAIDFADAFPQAEIRATDLSPIQPTWVPPNLKFEVDDAEEDWTYKVNFFDYIHFRTMCGCFQNWDDTFAKAYAHLAPGGYVEFQDYSGELFNSDGELLSGPDRFPNGLIEPYDPAVPDTSAVAYIFHLICKGSIKGGRPVPVARTISSNIKNAGFEDVKVTKIIWPLGGWPKDKTLKDLGKISRVGLSEGLHAFSAALLTRYLGFTADEVNDLVEKAKKDMLKGKYYSEAWFVHGRKPE
jgi:SAM-dependent methyltransferase